MNQSVNINDYWNYKYKKVYDYYVINAWRGLEKPLPAYTPEMVERHTKLAGKLPWVMPTPSADKKMVLASGNHATEFTGNWVLEGMVNFIAGNDPRAIYLRNKTIFYVYPEVNPEGRYMAVNRINLKAAPDPDAGTDMRKRGNPELYAAGLSDHNRVWTTRGKFSTIDVITSAMLKDTDGYADYLWDMHGPQVTGNWRTPKTEARTNAYAEALLKYEPDVVRCGPESGFKINGAMGPPGKLSLWAASKEGLNVKYPYVYEPGGWDKNRLMETGRNLALALYDVLSSD